MNIALPSLMRQLDASTRELQWVVDAYTFTFAALVLAAGSLSDRYGRKGALLTGLAVFGSATAVGGLVDRPQRTLGGQVNKRTRNRRSRDLGAVPQGLGSGWSRAAPQPELSLRPVWVA